jgi:hypothetical protein
MSLAQLTNAPFLNAVCKSVKCDEIVCPNVSAYNGVYATGAVSFLGTNVASLNLDYFVLNGVVNILVKIPSTVATAVKIISFTNKLPESIRPELNTASSIFVLNTTDGAHSQNSICTVQTDGTLGIVLVNDATNAENYSINAVIQYPL